MWGQSLQLCSPHRESRLSINPWGGRPRAPVCIYRGGIIIRVSGCAARFCKDGEIHRFQAIFCISIKSTNLCKARSRAPEEIFRICFFLRSGHDPLFSEKLVSDHIDLKFQISVQKEQCAQEDKNHLCALMGDCPNDVIESLKFHQTLLF